MKIRSLKIGWIGYLACWSLLLGWNYEAAAQKPDSPRDDVIFRLQFQGSNQFAQSTNAATFKEIWNLGSTKKLLDLFLDKLAQGTIRFYPSIPEKEHPGFLALVRPLFDDFLKRESHLELRGPTNQVHWLAAVLADGPTANHWNQQIKQLASKLSLNKVNILAGPETQGWVATSEQSGFSLKFTRTKTWITVMGGSNPGETFRDVESRLRKLDSPGPDLKGQLASVVLNPAPAGFWLPAFDWLGLPPLEFTAREEGEYIRSTVKLMFPEPLSMELEAWDIPFSAIRNPQDSLASFFAVRGVRDWLHNLTAISDLSPELIPNQFCSWGQSQFSGQTLLTAPVPKLTNTIQALAFKVPEWVTTAFKNSYTKMLWVSNKSEIVWQGLPMMAPFIKPLHSDGSMYLSAGIIPSLGATNPPPPVGLFPQLNKPDLFFYDWEITERRLLHYRHYVQLGLIMDRRQAMETNELTFHWIQNIHKMLGNTITVGTRVSPKELQLERKSHLGLSGSEIVFLTQWLKSDLFPYSFNFPGIVKPPPELLEKYNALQKRQKKPPATPSKRDQ